LATTTDVVVAKYNILTIISLLYLVATHTPYTNYDKWGGEDDEQPGCFKSLAFYKYIKKWHFGFVFYFFSLTVVNPINELWLR